jgi:hypothetical protein
MHKLREDSPFLDRMGPKGGKSLSIIPFVGMIPGKGQPYSITISKD